MTEALPRPDAHERLLKLNKQQRAKRRRGFLIGLLVGQLLILGLDFGGRLILTLLENRVQTNAPYSLEAIVFFGMASGVVLTGLLIFFVLGLQGVGYVFGKKKVGFFRAVGRGMVRCFKATWAVGLTLGIIGGTAWYLIPFPERDEMKTEARDRVLEARDRAEAWVQEILAPPAVEPDEVSTEDSAPDEAPEKK